MATLGFNAILSVLFVELVPLTGGPNGLAGIPPFRLLGFAFDTPARFFWLAWGAGLILMLLVASLLASRAGRALRAVSGSEVAADSMGIDPFHTKLKAFMFSAACAGVAGALYAHFNQYASPETFSLSTSVLLVVMVALGGWGHYWGPVLGAAVFTVVPELLHKFQDAELLVFGIGMVLVLLYLPGGLAGAPQRWKKVQLAFKRGDAVPTRAPATAMSAMNALEVSGVSVVFGGLKAVDDLSFRVAEGSIKGVIGPERRGQDHAVQCHFRHHAAKQRQGQPWRNRCHGSRAAFARRVGTGENVPESADIRRHERDRERHGRSPHAASRRLESGAARVGHRGRARDRSGRA